MRCFTIQVFAKRMYERSSFATPSTYPLPYQGVFWPIKSYPWNGGSFAFLCLSSKNVDKYFSVWRIAQNGTESCEENYGSRHLLLVQIENESETGQGPTASAREIINLQNAISRERRRVRSSLTTLWIGNLTENTMVRYIGRGHRWLRLKISFTYSKVILARWR